MKIIKENKLREFTKTDYYSYDVDKLPSGKNPLIYSSDELELIVFGIGDGCLIQIYNENEDALSTPVEMSETEAIRVANNIIKDENLSLEEIEDKYGLIVIN